MLRVVRGAGAWIAPCVIGQVQARSSSVLALEGDVVPGGGSTELVIALDGVVALRPGMPVCGTGSNLSQAVVIPWQ